MKSLFKIWVLIKQYWLHLFISVIALIGIIASRLMIPNIIKQVIDEGLRDESLEIIYNAALAVLIIGLVRGLFSGVQKYTSEYVAMNVAYEACCRAREQ